MDYHKGSIEVNTNPIKILASISSKQKTNKFVEFGIVREVLRNHHLLREEFMPLLNKLEELGYVRILPYKGVALTAKGRRKVHL